jgi:hypothetical protein
MQRQLSGRIWKVPRDRANPFENFQLFCEKGIDVLMM